MELSNINTAQVLQKVKDSCPTEKEFNKFFDAVDSTGTGKLRVQEFAELVKLSGKSAGASELDELFNVID